MQWLPRGLLRFGPMVMVLKVATVTSCPSRGSLFAAAGRPRRTQADSKSDVEEGGKVPAEVSVVVNPDGGISCAERLPSCHLLPSAVARLGRWSITAVPPDAGQKPAGMVPCVTLRRNRSARLAAVPARSIGNLRRMRWRCTRNVASVPSCETVCSSALCHLQSLRSRRRSRELRLCRSSCGPQHAVAELPCLMTNRQSPAAYRRAAAEPTALPLPIGVTAQSCSE